jgi:hypothetical protein
MKYGIIIFIGLLSSIGYSQSSQHIIIGEWRTCLVIGKKRTPDCDSSNLYQFKEDYCYAQIQNRPEKHVSEGVWNYTNKSLTINRNDDGNCKFYPYILKVKWIDNDSFYTVGREGFLGSKVYQYYFRLK